MGVPISLLMPKSTFSLSVVYVVIGLGAFLPVSADTLQEPVPIGAVSAVALYQDSALVSHVQPITLAQGANKLTLVGLPTNTVRQSVQIEVLEGMDCRVSEVAFAEAKENDADTVLQDIETRITEIQKAITLLGESRAVLEKQQQYAQELANSFTKGFGTEQSAPPTIDRAKEVWAYVQATLTEARSGVTGIREQISEKDKELKALEKTLAEYKARQAHLNAKLTVSLSTAAAGTAQLRVSYLVPDCGWSPAYEIRAEPGKKRLTLGYRAMAFQNTKQDWDAVKVTLHTGNANLSGNAPVLHGLYLSPIGGEGISKLASSYDSMDRAKSATIQQDVTSFQAAINEPVAMAGDGTQVRLEVLEKELPATFWTEITPSVLQQGYLLGECTNSMDMPLLAGPAIVFTDAKLTAQIDLPRVQPGESVKVSMGIDEWITVRRREGRIMEQQTGLIDKTTTLKREFHNDITNTRSTPHEVRIRDRFPVSRNAKIEVRTQSPKTSEVELDADTGLFEWKQQLNGGTTRTFSTRYEVVYPRDWTLNTTF